MTLAKDERVYRCGNGHSYDISKKGYVNLAMSQKSSKKRHGDDKLMVTARRDFLDKGYYAPLRDAAAHELKARAAQNAVIVDAGCGEGYYTAAIKSALGGADVYGVDISKDALIYAAKRDKTLTLAAASAASIPIETGCADAVVSIFAPVFPAEFSRLLKKDGILLRAVPLEDHLFSLKAAIYDEPYKNPTETHELDGFDIIAERTVCRDITLATREDIEALFMMTPYYYKTSRSDQQKLLSRDTLTTQTRFGIIVYRKHET